MNSAAATNAAALQMMAADFADFAAFYRRQGMPGMATAHQRDAARFARRARLHLAHAVGSEEWRVEELAAEQREREAVAKFHAAAEAAQEARGSRFL